MTEETENTLPEKPKKRTVDEEDAVSALERGGNRRNFFKKAAVAGATLAGGGLLVGGGLFTWHVLSEGHKGNVIDRLEKDGKLTPGEIIRLRDLGRILRLESNDEKIGDIVKFNIAMPLNSTDPQKWANWQKLNGNPIFMPPLNDLDNWWEGRDYGTRTIAATRSDHAALELDSENRFSLQVEVDEEGKPIDPKKPISLQVERDMCTTVYTRNRNDSFTLMLMPSSQLKSPPPNGGYGTVPDIRHDHLIFDCRQLSLCRPQVLLSEMLQPRLQAAYTSKKHFQVEILLSPDQLSEVNGEQLVQWVRNHSIWATLLPSAEHNGISEEHFKRLAEPRQKSTVHIAFKIRVKGPDKERVLTIAPDISNAEALHRLEEWVKNLEKEFTFGEGKPLPARQSWEAYVKSLPPAPTAGKGK